MLEIVQEKLYTFVHRCFKNKYDHVHLKNYIKIQKNLLFSNNPILHSICTVQIHRSTMKTFFSTFDHNMLDPDLVW